MNQENIRNFVFPLVVPSTGNPFDSTCSAELNSACAKVFLRKTL